MYRHTKIGPTQGGEPILAAKNGPIHKNPFHACTMQKKVAMPDKIWNLTFFYVHGSYIQCSNSTANL